MSGTNVIVGTFEDRNQAEDAVDELEHSGFSHSQVGFAIRGHDATDGGMITDAVGTHDGTGALAGAATGAVAGGILGAVVSLIIPPLGPVILGGVLATAVGFAGAGAAVGGILGAMTGLGLSKEEALYYEEQFHAGKAIVAVNCGADASTPELAEQAVRILRNHGGFIRRDQIPTDGPQPPVEYSGT